MRALRICLIVAGLGFVAWGSAGLLDEQSWSDLTGLAVWLGGAVVAHDGLLAPTTLLLGLAAWRLPRRLPNPVRQVIVAGTVVAGALTLLAVPSIIRHPIASNPSALPHDYVANLGWLLMALAVVTTAAALWAWRRDRRAANEPRD